jgi:hypothetical protein
VKYLILYFLRPLAFPLIVTAAVAILGGGYILYQRHDAVKDERIRVEKKNDEQISVAKKARERARNTYRRNPAAGVPDRWLRD